jgi:hypothetical protein
MRKFLFVLLVFPVWIYAQEGPQIFFKKTVIDFGTVKEETGEVKLSFKYKNTGNMPLIVERVYPSCGCTTADYTKTPLKKGKTGVINLVFHTKNSPGPIEKTVLIYSNSITQKELTLTIKGYVIPRQKTIEDNYVQSIGNLKLKTNHLAFNQIKNTETKADTFWFFNSAKSKMKITFDKLPEWINVSEADFVIKPKSEKYVIITYFGNKRNDWGLIFDKIHLKTNDDTLKEKTFFVSAQIDEDFSFLSIETLSDAPQISVDNTDYNFGEVREGSSVKHDFIISNKGKSDLILRKIQASCGCTTLQTPTNVIKPGESIAITAYFMTSGRQGEQHKTISIITNDPAKPFIMLNIIGNILPF